MISYLLPATDTPSIFAPAGPVAAREALLGWGSAALGSVIFIIVCVVLAIGLWRRREAATERVDGSDVAVIGKREHGRELRAIVIFGFVLPAIVLVGVYTWSISEAIALAVRPEGQQIEVVGHQWWWEVRYPAEGVTTANEIHVPEGVPVRVRVSSADVIHSFWVPRLLGKIDLIPGDTNDVWMRADSLGQFLGMCAEYCGVQHARMRFMVVSRTPDEYAAWLTSEKAPARAAATASEVAGQQHFMSTGCAGCHTVRGTAAAGVAGPDLTHFASRLTIGAGTLPNTRGNLAGWIANPQHIKPGNHMPELPITGPELQSILDYVGALR